MSRVEWFKRLYQVGRPGTRIEQIRVFIKFEIYYQLCRLRGYPVRHFIDQSRSPMMTVMRANEKYFMVWPDLPLSIRLLDKLFSFEDFHAKCRPYSAQLEDELKISGKRARLFKFRCELQVMP